MNHRRLAACALVIAPLLAGCPNDVGFPTDPDETARTREDGRSASDDRATEDPYWCCDPDEGQCVCQGYWRCTEGFEGKTCRQANPNLPDGGGDGPWSCAYEDDLIVCVGDARDHPDAGGQGDWTCTEDAVAGTIECSREATPDDYPDGGTDTPWDCTFSSQAEMRACREESEQAPEDGSWECWTGDDGTTTCVHRDPETPDDGTWDCVRVDGEDVCQGDHHPEDGAGEGWSCEDVAEMVRCSRGDGQSPDDGGDAVWDCTWERGSLVCVDLPDDGGDDGGIEPGGPDDGGGDGGGGDPESPDDGGGDDAPCGCVVGTTRTCDEPTFCLFGEQTCLEVDGGQARWGACTETPILDGCQPGGQFAAELQWEYRGGFWDNEEQRANDLDGDGRILMPPDWWYNPAGEDCAIRLGRCVQDMWDLDADGDNQESIGTCQGIDECA